MARINPSWFEFNDIRSDSLDVRLMDVHSFARGEARGTRETAAGRSGEIWLGDGAFETFEILRVCRAPAARLREISAWLRGEGRLRFSGEPGAMYDARVADQIEYRRVIPGMAALFEFSVTFVCHPFPRLWPEAEPIAITASGTPISNPGAAPALPRVEIVGSGDFSLTIGMQTLFFTGVEGGIIVDSELGDALTPDAALLANDRINGELFAIQPGYNVVSWLAGGADGDPDSPGSVERVVITPRWRSL